MGLIIASTSSVDSAVLSGVLHLPLYGVPIYDVVIDHTAADDYAAGTAVTIKCDGGLTLSGTIADARAGDFLNTVHIRVVGGKNGIWKQSKPSGYMQPSALLRDVLNGLMRDSGESLSSSISQSLLSTNLAAWMVTQRPVAESLDVLLQYVSPDSGWRILSDGTLWIGAETWPASSDSYVMLVHDPVDGHYELGVDVPTIVPGIDLGTVNAIGDSPVIGKVAIVEHHITGDDIRTRVWKQLDSDRGPAAAVTDMARHALANIDFFCFYDVTVKSQSGDLTTVDVNPPTNLPAIGGLQRVPLRHGLPGCKVQVPSNTIVRLGWDRGDPRYPFAALWNGGESPQSVQIAGNTAAFIIGANGELGTLTLTVAGSATLAWTYVDANGTSTSGASGAPITLTGKKTTVVGLG